jgi:hypothetical protein
MAFRRSSIVVRYSIFGLLLVAFFQFSRSAKAQTTLGPSDPTPSLADGIDCLTPEHTEAPLQTRNSPGRLPGGPEQLPSVSADRASLPPRFDQETPLTTGTTIDPTVLRQPGFPPAFLFSTHSSGPLPENIRERAPPVPA